MSTVKIEIDNLDGWFQAELIELAINFIQKIGAALDEADREIEALKVQGFDESLQERLERDIKASKLDDIDKAFDAFIN